MRNILQEFPELTDVARATLPNKHQVECHIVRIRQCAQRLGRLTQEKLDTAKKYFELMCLAGICRRSSLPWSSGLHLVPKKDGSWRPCGDYRHLNNLTIRDNYPLPHLHDCTSRLAGATVFSKIDLVRGYHQIPVRASDVQNTAIATPFGLYKFVRMPFSLKNAAQTFQPLMDTVTQDLLGVFVYLDDVLIASSSVQEHIRHLRGLCKALRWFGLVVNREKCVFGVSELEFLGHRLSRHSLEPLPEKVRAIVNFQQPATMKSLQRFLGMINFYRRFLPGLAAVIRPLMDSLAGSPKNFSWTADMTKAFQKAKSSLAHAAMLAHPVRGAELQLVTDASEKAIGAVIQQVVHGQVQPLAFFSRRTTGPESRYSTYDLELQSIYSAILHFRHMLEGRALEIFTDQRPLTSAFFKVKDPISNRQRNQLGFISEFCTDIAHVPGLENVVADALSCQFGDAAIVNTIAHRLADIDLDQLAIDQEQDKDCRAVVKGSSLQMKRLAFPGIRTQLWCDVSLQRPRIFVPLAWRQRIFNAMHGLAHPSRRTTLAMASKSYVWSAMKRDIKKWAKQCFVCARNMKARHMKPPIESIPVPKDGFEHIHVDLVGPFPPDQGFQHVLTIIDRTTRQPEAIPLKETKVETITQHSSPLGISFQSSQGNNII